MPDDPSVPQPTPTNYQRTTGGHLRWQPPTPEQLQEMLPAYEILSILGQGGMGAVYKGRQKSLDRIVAIKILPPEAAENDMQFVERFKNEARTMAKMNHASIVHVYDFGETSDGQLYIVMEFIDGTDVAKMIQSQGKLPEDYALSITAHVCDALQYAHTHGIVHRDIKPANVLINMEGQVKVADFGLAKATDPSQMGLTKTNMAMGTPDFVSPEALMPGVPLDGRADLYAVGVMLYNMLTGTIPRGAFRMPSTTLNTDARFDQIICKAMEMDRERRYQTALDLRRDLDVILTTPAAKTGMQTIPAQQVAAQQSLPQKPMGRGPGVPQHKEGSAGPPARSSPAADKSVRAPVQPPKKSNTGMIYGIAAAVVVIAVAAFMFTGGGKKPPEVKPVAESKPEPTRPAPKTATPSAISPVPSAGWQMLFTDADWRRSEPGKREWVNGQLHLLRMSKTKPWPSADGAIRTRIHFKDGSKNISLTARGMNADELYKLNVNKGGTIGLASIGPDGRTLDNLGKHVLPKPLQPGDTLLLELRLQGDRLTALVNGAVVIEARNSRYSAPGKWGILADDGWFESVEMQTLGTQNSIVSTPPPTSKPSDMLTFGGHRYRHLPDILSWTAAKAKAEAMGGHLATITSKEENDWIKQNFITGLPAGTGVWLGATHDGVPGQWRWVTDEPFDFKGWGPGEPNDRPEELAISFARSDQGPLAWYDMRDSGFGNKDRRSGLLIEWDDVGQTKSPPLATAPSTPGTINLLQDLIIGRDAIAGGWSMPGGELHSKGNTYFDRLAFSVPVPEEYDFRVEFTRVSGARAVAQHLALPDGRDVMWLMGAFDNKVRTFEIVDGLPGDNNPSTVKRGLENGRRYECVVKVRRDRIRAEIDGKLVSEIRPASVKLAVFDKWKFTDSKKLGVGAQQPTVFHRVELIPVGPAQPSVSEGSRLASAVPPSAEPPAPMRSAEPVNPHESDPRLAQLAAGFKARYEADAEKPYLAAVAALNQSYIANGIGRARAAAQQKGALEEVTALDTEKRRIENNEPLPPAELETLPESLKTLRATYRAALGKIEADRVQKAAPLYDLYLGALDAYIAELTKGNKIDEAQKVNTLRETIATQKPKTDSGPATATTGTPTRPGMSRPGTKPAPSNEDSSEGGRGSRWYDAARWVVSMGGSLRVNKNGESFIVNSEDKIPAGRFAILEVHLTGNPKSQGIRDDDFTRFSGLKELTALNLTKIQATDAAFAFLPTTPNLTRVVLSAVPMTDAVLAHLAPLANLTDLHIQDAPKFTGAGLEKLASLPILTSVWFSNSGLNDAGAKALLGGKNLEFVRLEGTSVTDEGISGFGVLTKLTHINLSRCMKVRGTTLAGWGSMPSLRELYLSGCLLSADTYPVIGKFTSLATLHLDSITALNDATLPALAPLTKLTALGLGRTSVTGTGFAALGGLTELKILHVAEEAPISAEGLATIAATFPKLEELSLGQGAQLNAADFHPLMSLKSLKTLRANLPALDDAALAEIARITSLETFYAQGTAVKLQGIVALKPLKFLTKLGVPLCKNIDDSAIPVLKDFKGLKELDVRSTVITEAGIVELRKALPGCNVLK